MVYNWDGKESECFRLYVEEKKSLDEVMSVFEREGFTPSKRAFQTQFKRWNFPSKQSPAHKNSALIARVKDLWEVNTVQRDMLGTLRNEGFQINDRELTRLRLRFGLLLRDNSGRSSRRQASARSVKVRSNSTHRDLVTTSEIVDTTTGEDLGRANIGENVEEVADEPGNDQRTDEVSEGDSERATVANQVPPPLSPDEVARRQERLQKLQLESAEKWRNRKRRRRTRGWASLPADAPGEPPRFPSETTIDESKAYLGLDNRLYRQLREQFQAICETEGVIKKTIAGPEKWGRIKDRLIGTNTYLSNVFQHDPEARQQSNSMTTPSNLRALSLDIICTDVTKRMRTVHSRMGIPEAKNILSLNPEQARHVRKAFTARLKEDHFTNKFEAGDEHWNQLKQSWIQECSPLVQTLGAAHSESENAQKLKAIEVLARDIMKRFRDDKLQKDPSQKKSSSKGQGPGPAPPSYNVSVVSGRRQELNTTEGSDQLDATLSALSGASALQIDPSLLLAASDPSLTSDLSHSRSHISQNQTRYILPDQFFGGAPLPIYFRLHSQSTTTLPGKTVWLGILQAATVAEIRTLAMREHPGTIVMQIEGLVVHKIQGQPEREVTIGIDDEDELAAYLEHVSGGKATFVVLLGPATRGGYV